MPRRKKRRLLSQHSNKPTTSLYNDMERGMQQAVDVSYALIGKFPKREKQHVGLGNDIKEAVNEAEKQVIRLCAYNPALDDRREVLLRELSVQLKFTNSLLEVAYKQCYISAKQLNRWGGLISDVDGKAIGLAMWCQQQARKQKAAAEKAAADASCVEGDSDQTKLSPKEEPSNETTQS